MAFGMNPQDYEEAYQVISKESFDSSKLTFLIIWVIGMFIISAALIFVAYADHQLKRFLGEVKQYVPRTDAELDALLDKISRDGINSLSAYELARLRRAREEMRGK